MRQSLSAQRHPATYLEPAIKVLIEREYKILACSERKPERSLRPEDLYGKICFLIGPEGGWSEQEFALLERNGVEEISISNLILRAETAAIAIAAQWNLLVTM